MENILITILFVILKALEWLWAHRNEIAIVFFTYIFVGYCFNVFASWSKEINERIDGLECKINELENRVDELESELSDRGSEETYDLDYGDLE